MNIVKYERFKKQFGGIGNSYKKYLIWNEIMTVPLSMKEISRVLSDKYPKYEFRLNSISQLIKEDYLKEITVNRIMADGSIKKIKKYKAVELNG